MEEQTHTYSLKRETHWKDSLQDGLLPFTDINHGIVELNKKELDKTKNEKYELSEANCYKGFKTESIMAIANNKLCYYPVNQ